MLKVFALSAGYLRGFAAQKFILLCEKMRFTHFFTQQVFECVVLRLAQDHTLKYIRGAPQARASERNGNQIDSERVKR